MPHPADSRGLSHNSQPTRWSCGRCGLRQWERIMQGTLNLPQIWTKARPRILCRKKWSQTCLQIPGSDHVLEDAQLPRGRSPLRAGYYVQSTGDGGLAAGNSPARSRQIGSFRHQQTELRGHRDALRASNIRSSLARFGIRRRSTGQPKRGSGPADDLRNRPRGY